MKYIIKNILKEDYVNKKKNQDYLDFIVNEMLNGIEIEKDWPPNPPINSLTDYLNLYGEYEYDSVVSDPEIFNKLGWEEKEYDEGWYYFRKDNPKDEYNNDEFFYEFGYDWLDYLTNSGELRKLGYNSETTEWEVVYQDLLLKLRLNDKLIKTVPLHRIFSKHKYTNPIQEKRNFLGLEVMTFLVDVYKISTIEVGVVLEKFKPRLNNLLKDKWGIDVVGIDELPYLVKGGHININESIVDDFIEFGKNELSLGDGFNVRLTDDNDELETLASYDMSDNEITVLQKNRAVPDIIRSIAHEMVHHKQNELGDLKGNPEEGEDGSPWEDQANSKAGELVRMFGREYPEIYDL